MTHNVRSSLNRNLHQSILGALAANLASTSDHDDVALLTDQFASVVQPVTNGAVNGVLARLNAVVGGTEGQLRVVRHLGFFAADFGGTVLDEQKGRWRHVCWY